MYPWLVLQTISISLIYMMNIDECIDCVVFKYTVYLIFPHVREGGRGGGKYHHQLIKNKVYVA
jgi:hypothetical protein